MGEACTPSRTSYEGDGAGAAGSIDIRNPDITYDGPAGLASKAG